MMLLPLPVRFLFQILVQGPNAQEVPHSSPAALAEFMAELESDSSQALPPNLLPPHPAPLHSSLSCCQAETAGLAQSFGWGWGRAGLGLWRAGESHSPPPTHLRRLWLWLVSSRGPPHSVPRWGSPEELETDGQSSEPTRCRCLWGPGPESGNPMYLAPLPSSLHVFSDHIAV